MSDFTGAERTNYVTIADMEGLLAFLDGSGIELVEQEGKHALLPPDMSGDGCFPTGWGDDDDFEFEMRQVMKYVAVNEVLVIVSAGHERLRYVSGYASAYVRRADDTIERISLSLTQIYAEASKKFGINYADISPAEY